MDKEQSNGRRTDILSRIYYNLSNVAGHTSTPKVLWRKAKEEGLDVTLKDIEHFLSGQLSYTRHKQPTRKFPRRKVLILRPNRCWASDLGITRK